MSGAAALFALLFGGAQSRGEELTRPNVVLIYVDDLGYKDLTCYGSIRPAKSGIQSMSAKVMTLRVENMYSASTVFLEELNVSSSHDSTL